MNFLFFLKASVFELGITVSIVGFLIVFFSLSLLVVVFTNIPTMLKVNFRKRKKSDEKVVTPRETSIEGNVTAAISLALHIYLSEMHDEESNIVTIKQIRKAYSPWSSKIYSVTQNWPKY
ncbi:MAG: OadG family protein [Mariniphaga sp.]|jgi:Na+-transporting methylmalonyl-CoA/oxaloacetate decarboxylase gamma subunit|nr:OadG family protein [Mariniphaga sp.]